MHHDTFFRFLRGWEFSMIMSVTVTDQHLVRSAEGWLELGLQKEALRELESLEPGSQTHPQVLAVRMSAAYKEMQWDVCLEMALMLVRAEPDKPAGFVTGSIALYRLNRTEEAWHFLLPVADKFKDDWQVPYNLACYAAQLGWKERALGMVGLALKRGERATITYYALRDPDLKPIWQDIAG